MKKPDECPIMKGLACGVLEYMIKFCKENGIENPKIDAVASVDDGTEYKLIFKRVRK